MIRTLLLVALVLPLTAMGCATAQSASGDASPDAPIEAAVPGEPFRLGVGETARVDGHTIRFVAVIEDSRCPEGVDCIRAGEAHIQVEIDGDLVELTVPHGMMGDGETAEARVGSQRLAVTDLVPYPGSAAAEAGDPVEAVFVTRS